MSDAARLTEAELVRLEWLNLPLGAVEPNPASPTARAVAELRALRKENEELRADNSGKHAVIVKLENICEGYDKHLAALPARVVDAVVLRNEISGRRKMPDQIDHHVANALEQILKHAVGTRPADKPSTVRLPHRGYKRVTERPAERGKG